MALGVLFFSSGGVTEGTSLPRLGWDVGVRAALGVRGDEVRAAEDLLPFFSTPLLGTNISRAGGSFRGVPNSPGAKDRKEQ